MMRVDLDFHCMMHVDLDFHYVLHMNLDRLSLCAAHGLRYFNYVLHRGLIHFHYVLHMVLDRLSLCHTRVLKILLGPVKTTQLGPCRH